MIDFLGSKGIDRHFYKSTYKKMGDGNLDGVNKQRNFERIDRRIRSRVPNMQHDRNECQFPRELRIRSYKNEGFCMTGDQATSELNT